MPFVQIVSAAGDPRWDLFLPSAPTAVIGFPSDQYVALHWTAPAVNPAPALPVTDYAIQYSDDDGATWTPYADVVSTETSVNVTGLTNGTAYKFRVRAINGVGLGTYSDVSAAYTPAGPETALLMHFDGDLADSSGNNQIAVATGGAAPSATESKFGSGSAYFPGTPANGDGKITVAADSNVGTEDFTIEAWIFLDPITTAQDGPCIIELGSHSGYGSDGLILMAKLQDGNWVLWAWCFPTGGPLPATSNSITPGEWTHVALTRQSGVFRIFINGVKGAEFTSTESIAASSNSIQIGGSLNGAIANAFGGYVDEVRFLRGGAVYVADFTPPTVALT